LSEYRGYRIVEGSALEHIGTVSKLLEDHYQELAKNKQLMHLKPDVEKYEALEAGGVLFTLLAFKDDKIVGYSVNFIQNHLHYADLVYGQNDLLYLDPEHRNGGLGIRLIHETEKRIKEKGARMMIWHAKENTALMELMPRLGYGVQDVLFSKEI